MRSAKALVWKATLRWVQRNSDGQIGQRVQRISTALQRASTNVSFDFPANGEERVVKIAARITQAPVIFDVGANVGNWSLTAADWIGDGGRVLAFEPSAATFRKLRERTARTPAITAFELGLSDVAGPKNMVVNSDRSAKDSVEASARKRAFGQEENLKTVSANFVRGDEFCREHAIDRISLLKVDAEGHDYQVICGFGAMIETNRIDAIQFEYTTLNIYTKKLLWEFYDLLPNYRIGRVFPHSIRFKDYDKRDETFMEGNFLAVRPSISCAFA